MWKENSCITFQIWWLPDPQIPTFHTHAYLDISSFSDILSSSVLHHISIIMTPNPKLTNPNHGSLFFSIFSGIPISKTIPLSHFEIQVPNHSMPFSLFRFLPHPLSFFSRDIHIYNISSVSQKARPQDQVKRPGHNAWSQCQVAKPGCNVKNKYTHFLPALSLIFLYTFLNH